jgi:hypothetical protein
MLRSSRRSSRIALLALAAAAPLACAAPSFGTPGPDAVATFNSIGVYWAPAGGGEANAARLEFREAGKGPWRAGLAPWFDARNAEYRGSIVELAPDTAYEIRLTLDGGFSQTLRARTWSERFRVQRTVQVAPGTTRLVIDAADSGDAQRGYVVFTAKPGANVIDQAGIEGDERRDSCVVVKQGAHHVIIRGLVLRNCKRHGVLIERQFKPVLEAQSHDIVIEDNEISGWGGFARSRPDSGLTDNDGAIHCDYARETEDAKRPDRIVIQGNTLRDPRHGANPWVSGGERRHPEGPYGIFFNGCGRNHVIRYNAIYSRNGNHFNDGMGGTGNFSLAGFPWADSDIHGNRISQVHDDAIEAEGANRNVRIWGNYFDQVLVAVANAATATGPLYVWRNVSNRMAGMDRAEGDPDLGIRGSFIKAGSNHPSIVGGRAYYFHNTVLQAPGGRYPLGAGSSISKAGGVLYNLVSRNNIWHVHKEAHIDGQPKFYSIRADADRGLVDADYDLYNGRMSNAGRGAERRGWPARPVYASSGKGYPDLAERPGDFSLSPSSPGFGAAERIANFNDRYARPDVGAHQSGTPPMRFGPELRGRAR